MDLRRVRFEKRISQHSLSKDSGVHQSRISLIENGLHTPKPEEIEAICQVLEIPPTRITWPK
jgi:transcriptional regulator with XRE-family HTH domain